MTIQEMHPRKRPDTDLIRANDRIAAEPATLESALVVVRAGALLRQSDAVKLTIGNLTGTEREKAIEALAQNATQSFTEGRVCLATSAENLTWCIGQARHPIDLWQSIERATSDECFDMLANLVEKLSTRVKEACGRPDIDDCGMNKLARYIALACSKRSYDSDLSDCSGLGDLLDTIESRFEESGKSSRQQIGMLAVALEEIIAASANPSALSKSVESGLGRMSKEGSDVARNLLQVLWQRDNVLPKTAHYRQADQRRDIELLDELGIPEAEARKVGVLLEDDDFSAITLIHGGKVG